MFNQTLKVLLISITILASSTAISATRLLNYPIYTEVSDDGDYDVTFDDYSTYKISYNSALYTTYYFYLGGFSEGAYATGYFVASDLNNDGYMSGETHDGDSFSYGGSSRGYFYSGLSEPEILDAGMSFFSGNSIVPSEDRTYYHTDAYYSIRPDEGYFSFRGSRFAYLEDWSSIGLSNTGGSISPGFLNYGSSCRADRQHWIDCYGDIPSSATSSSQGFLSTSPFRPDGTVVPVLPSIWFLGSALIGLLGITKFRQQV